MTRLNRPRRAHSLEPREYSLIDLPWLERSPSAVVLVKQTSPLRERRLAARAARYFRRETGFQCMDCSLDARASPKRHGNLTTVQLITTPETGGYISGSRTIFVEGCRMVGAAGFYPFLDKGWRMRWVWIHPFWRGKGILAKEWPRFVELFGADFFPEPPLSVAMRAFLKKHMTRDQQRLWFPRYERGKPTRD